MAGVIVAAALIGSLLLVHFSLQWWPLPHSKPLDVDYGLPLPEVAQASTVFSLTALFGAYLGIYLLLGIPALLGLGAGTTAGLLVIRRWIGKHPSKFETYLEAVLGDKRRNAEVLAFSLALVQCGFAASELVILKNFVASSLALTDAQANLMAIALALIGYFYVLFGGYMAVFRTDLLQFCLVASMILVFLVILVSRHGTINVTGMSLLSHVAPRKGYWTIPRVSAPAALSYFYHFMIAGFMGFGFLLASPDAWKRVFLVSPGNKAKHWRFAVFTAVGIAPFLLLIPIGSLVRHIPDGPFDARTMWAGIAARETIFIAMASGLVASFLSAFSGALVVSVHVTLIAGRKIQRSPAELPRFHWLMVSALLMVVLLYSALQSYANPYVLGTFLLGPYAILGGVMLGCRGAADSVPDGSLFWILMIGLILWLMYFGSHGSTSVPSTFDANAVPWGVLLGVLTAVACKTLLILKRWYVRQH